MARREDFNFFQNKSCRYFPCHDTTPKEDFNCLFCYCPLFLMEDCGGRFTRLDDGTKDCSNCTKNHDKDSWKFVIGKLREANKYKVKFNTIKEE